jgi:glycosyltransferase involved in cell wall biosynthesis
MILDRSRFVKPAIPFFSVIITTYNRADLLVRALDSLICQTENDWEAIIIDDGSNDDTAERISPFLNSEKRIVYIRQQRRGASVAKNTGIFLSKGKYITFLDSDDELSLSSSNKKRNFAGNTGSSIFVWWYKSSGQHLCTR